MSEDLTPREVADELGVTVRTVQRWIAGGRLPASRIGSRVRVSRSSLATVAEGAEPRRWHTLRGRVPSSHHCHSGPVLFGDVARESIPATQKLLAVAVVVLRASAPSA